MTPQRSPNRLREIMDIQGVSMIKLSGAGVSVTTISSIINGNHVPGSVIRQRIAQALKVPESEIWPELEVPTL